MRNYDARNRAFQKVCVDIYMHTASRGKAPTLDRIVAMANTTSPDYFYVDSVYAYNKLLKMFASGYVRLPRSERDLMWLELAEKVKAVQLRKKCAMAPALDYVLLHSRPSGFFLSQREGMRLARIVFERRTEHRPRRPK